MNWFVFAGYPSIHGRRVSDVSETKIAGSSVGQDGNLGEFLGKGQGEWAKGAKYPHPAVNCESVGLEERNPSNPPPLISEGSIN